MTAGTDSVGTTLRPSSAPVPRCVVIVKMLAAFLGFSALVTEVATLAARHRFNAGNFFSYFTVEANTLAVLSLVLGAFAAATGMTGVAGQVLNFYRGAVALYMTTVILIFIVLLSGYPSSDLTAVAWDNTVLHYIMPIVIIVDWLLPRASRRVAYRSAISWLAFPMAYLAYSLIRGHFVHWYPYPFMNPHHNGYLALVITSLVIAVVLAAITWLIANTPRWTTHLSDTGAKARDQRP